MTATPDRHQSDHQLPDRRPGDRQPSRWRSGDRQPRRLAVLPPPVLDDDDLVTHRIVTPPPGGDDLAEVAAGGVLARVLELRPFQECADQVDYARNGAYSTSIDGWWRNANVWFVRLIAIPGILLCSLAKWSYFSRLSRTLISVPVTAFLLMLGNDFPVTAWLIPDAADFTTWFAPPMPPESSGAVG